MDRNYLLTYRYTNLEGMFDSDFAWFETYEELKEFVEDMGEIEDFKVCEIIKINSCEIL